MALDTLVSLWQRSDGLDNAGAMLRAMVDATAAERRPALFQEWAVFLHSLARTSWKTMLRYLLPNACVVEALGGSASRDECLRSFEMVEQWWGTNRHDEDKDNLEKENGNSEGCPDDLVPASQLGSPAAFIKIFIEGEQFDRARRLLDLLPAASPDEAASLFDSIANSLLYSLAAAGKFDTLGELLAKISCHSLEALEMLVRQLVVYGRSDDAKQVLASVESSLGSEAAIPLAVLILESDLAEDRLPESFRFFEQLTAVHKTERALEGYVDIAFMLANAFLKRGQPQSADEIVKILRERAAPAPRTASLRLSRLAEGVRDPVRADFWNRTARSFA